MRITWLVATALIVGAGSALSAPNVEVCADVGRRISVGGCV